MNHLSFTSIEGPDLLKTAARQTGLDDFGDESFEQAFQFLVQSLENDADLNLIGRICARNYVLGLLRNRLKLREDRKRHPEIAEEKIHRPIFITGLPRTGSTLLQALMAADVRNRSPLVWEVMYPSPPPRWTYIDSDPRIFQAGRELKWLNLLMPRFKTSHIIDARLPQECIAITAHSFRSQVFESMFFVSSFRRWHEGLDKLPSYECHREFLQHLQWRCPGNHWVLKAPSHLFSIDELFQIYPDALVVMTHRDPAKVLASCASFTEILRAPFVDSIDKPKLGLEIAVHWAKGARLGMDFRKNHPELRDRFFDVKYPDLVNDPLNVVKCIYSHFGMELTSESEEAMRGFMEKNPQNKNGIHAYKLEDYGLELESERQRFRFYTEHFGIVSE